MWAILVGNPAEGFSIYGPFGSESDASYYCDHILGDQLEGWIFEMNKPDWANNIIPKDTKPRSNHN